MSTKAPHDSARLDTSLEALAQAKLAYRFAPSSYTFDAMRAVMNAIAVRVAPDWISDAEYEAGSACKTDPDEKATPGSILPSERVRRKRVRLAAIPANRISTNNSLPVPMQNGVANGCRPDMAEMTARGIGPGPSRAAD